MLSKRTRQDYANGLFIQLNNRTDVCRNEVLFGGQHDHLSAGAQADITRRVIEFVQRP